MDERAQVHYKEFAMKFRTIAMDLAVAAAVGLPMVVFLAGCGESSAPSSRAAANAPTVLAKLIEPCGLLSKGDAESYIGQPLKDPERKETPVVGLKLCVYDTVSAGSGKLLQIGLTQQAFMPNNGQTPQSIYAALKANFRNAINVDGIGDDAFISPPGLHVLKGGFYLTVAVGNSNDPKNQELLQTIGKRLVAEHLSN
jgi:hypothetical protein